MQRFSLSAVQFRGEFPAPLAFAMGMMAGSVWYFSIGAEPSLNGLMGIAVFSCAGAIWLQRRAVSSVFLSMAIIVCGASAGALAGGLATQRADHVMIAEPTGPVLLEGWIMDAQRGRSGVRLVIGVHAIDGLDAELTPKKVRLTHTLSLNIEPGRYVRCWAVLRPPPQPVISGDYNFARQAWFSGLGGVGYVQGRCRGGALGPPLGWSDRANLMLGTWRRQLARHVDDAAGGRAGGFAAALASGDRSFMRADDQDALRGSGLAHLLAISGLHMGIVGGLVFLFFWRVCALIEPIALRWPVKKPAAFGALLACTAYLLISGAGLSTQRAFIMSAVAFGAILFDRTAISLRSLSMAMIIILILAPWSVLTPGFQMSFAATGALIATYEAWRRERRKAPHSAKNGPVFWLKSLFVTSTVSGLATMPFALFHFERIAGFGLIANLLAMPIISLISAPLAGASLLLAPLGGDVLILRWFGLSLELVLQIAHLFADWGSGSAVNWPKMPGISLALFTLAISAYAIVSGQLQKMVAMAACVIAASFVWSMSGCDRLHWAPSGELFVEAKTGAIQRFDIQDGDGLPPLRFADLPITQSCETLTQCPFTLANTVIEHRYEKGDSVLIVTGQYPEYPPSNPIRIAWSDVVQENGITLERRGREWVRLEKPACGGRAWRPCRSNE
jgi:competence protein ComEC